MNPYILSVLLGIVEGLTEFLPVSSTAHLRIVQAWLQIDLKDPFWKMYTIVIQLGAILALVAFFWKRIVRFLRSFPRGEKGQETPWTHPLSLILIAFVFTAVPALALKKLIGAHLEDTHLMALSLLIGGIIMWAVDWIFSLPKTLHIEEMNTLQAICIGAVQSLAAIFPGASRSMCTIAAGQAVGMSRASALEFSFFLSIPTMVAATGKELVETLRPGRSAVSENLVPLQMGEANWIILTIGFVVSFIVALGVVAWFMRWVQRHGFLPFALYRILFGALLLSHVIPS